MENERRSLLQLIELSEEIRRAGIELYSFKKSIDKVKYLLKDEEIKENEILENLFDYVAHSYETIHEFLNQFVYDVLYNGRLK